MKGPALIKVIALTVAIFVESLVLSQSIIDFINIGDIFSISMEFSIEVVLLMLLLVYTFSLTAGGWDKWAPYVMIPVPVALALFLVTYINFPSYALFVALGTLLILSYDVYKSVKLKGLLVRFDPKMILRFSTRGVLFVFSVLGGVLFMLHATSLEPFNVGRKVSEIAGDSIQKIVEEQIDKNLSNQMPFLGNDPGILKTLGLLNSPMFGESEKGLGGVVENQVNSMVEPYRNFVRPIMAIITFSIFQFYAYIAHVIFIASVDFVFWMVKKTKFFKTEMAMVEQEHLTF